VEKKEQLIIEVITLFMRYGIKSLTLDDIARHLAISKKTLYQFFKDKNDLVSEAFKYALSIDYSIICSIQSKGLNAIDELIEISEKMSMRHKQMHPSLLYDLQKYHSDAWKMLLEYKGGVITACVESNLKRGIEEGFFRQEISTEIIAKIYASKIESVFDGELFPHDRYDTAYVYKETILYHLYAVCDEKGRKYLNKKIKSKLDKPTS
jgi:AcrR family transcriptional regulator